MHPLPDVGFVEDANGVAYIGSQKSGYELMHRIPQHLLDAVWSQHSARVVPHGATLDVPINSPVSTHRIAPTIPSLAQNGGLSMDVWLHQGFEWSETVRVDQAPAKVSSVAASCDAGGFVLTLYDSSLEFNFTVAGEQTTIVPTGKCVDELSRTRRDTVADSAGKISQERLTPRILLLK